ncbi:MAG: hypothetical protein EBU49_09135, partial [Proteobacteria bacterium]|nr:hypothetical protein [Pseudomonadota bacterium]
MLSENKQAISLIKINPFGGFRRSQGPGDRTFNRFAKGRFLRSAKADRYNWVSRFNIYPTEIFMIFLINTMKMPEKFLSKLMIAAFAAMP